MSLQYPVMILLFLAVAVAPAVLDPGRAPTLLPADEEARTIPAEALEALEQGRFWRASRILRGYLATVPNPGPETLLLAAKADAGWGDWAHVRSLLEGQPWLDSYANGFGWNLLGRSQLELGLWADSGESLARYLALAPNAGERERGLAETRRGLALAAAGSAREAVAAFQRARSLVPQIADWLLVFAAEAVAQNGDTAGVKRWLSETDPQLAREWGWQSRVRVHANARDVRGALRAAEIAANELRDAGRRSEAWRVAGDYRLQLGDTEGARRAYRRAMEAAPQAMSAVEAARKLSELAGATPEEQLRVGRLFIRHGNFDRGIAGLEAYLASGLGTAAEAAQVRLELARAFFRGARYAEAEQRALALAGSAPDPSIGAEALLLAGRAQFRQSRTGESRATFRQTAARFPTARAAAEALFLVADLDHDQGRIASARQYYRRVASIRPDIDEAGLALMRLGGLAYAAGDFQGAARIFEEYRRHHPDGARYQQATYWAARSYHRIGETALSRQRLRQVRQKDPFTWYGIRAAEMLGEDFWDVPLDVSPPHNRKVDDEVAGALVRLDLLRELGKESAATFEVDRLKDHFLKTDGALYALAEAFNARGYTFTGIRLGWEIHRREKVWNHRLLRIIYPFPYRTMITAEARERGLDPFLVAGLIRQESMFNADIKSPAGAVGLMQIMPATGQSLAKQAGFAAFETSILEEPEVNLHLGVAYLAELIGRYGAQRLTSVLAAYNAGPHRVSRWSAFPEYRDEELFGERIPFAETRNYVKLVQQNARLYAALYGDTTASAKNQGD